MCTTVVFQDNYQFKSTNLKCAMAMQVTFTAGIKIVDLLSGVRIASS